MTIRLDGRSLSVDSLFESRRRCLRETGGAPFDEPEEEDEDDEGGDFPLAAGGGPREMGGRHMVVGERGRGASRQNLWALGGCPVVLDENELVDYWGGFL